MGCLEILNVQGGEVRLSFNTKDGAETFRARRYITEMMRQGFVLLVEIERDGEKRYERAAGFDEEKGEYLIADFVESEDPQSEKNNDKPRGTRRRKVPMEETNATAVGPSAGG